MYVKWKTLRWDLLLQIIFWTYTEIKTLSSGYEQLIKDNVYAMTRIRTWVFAATTRGTNHYTIMAAETCLTRHISWNHTYTYISVSKPIFIYIYIYMGLLRFLTLTGTIVEMTVPVTYFTSNHVLYIVSFMLIMYNKNFFFQHLHNKDMLCNTINNFEILWWVNNATILSHIFCSCSYLFRHILGYFYGR